MSANRIKNYLPATNRIAEAFVQAVPANCASFAMVPGSWGVASPAMTATTYMPSIYEIALEAARREVFAKRRFRQLTSSNWLGN